VFVDWLVVLLVVAIAAAIVVVVGVVLFRRSVLDIHVKAVF
jgi:hypothetical protein